MILLPCCRVDKPVHRRRRFANGLGLPILVIALAVGGFLWTMQAWAEVAPTRPTPIAQADKTPGDIDQLLQIEKKFKQVAAETLKCVVGIQVGKARGSGVLVSEDGLVLTAGHVAVKPGEKAKFVNSEGKMFEGVSLGVFASADAGMMKISGKTKWPCVKLGQIDDVELGDWCVAIGHPLGFKKGRPPVVRIGRILRIENRVIQTDCPLISGDSGGPLFDLDGKLIGINSRIGGMANMNFHIPISVFQEFWKRLKKGEGWKDRLPERSGGKIKASFRKVVADVSKCVVRIRCNGKQTVLGTIVGPDGWILTKASELKGRVVIRLPDGRDLEARTVGIDSRFDLAMLKIDALDLPKIKWSLKDPTVGQWVAVPGLDKDPLAVGVVSLPRRGIPPTRGTLGITIGQTKDGIVIIAIIPKSPADKAGLKRKDVITHINGKAVKDQKALMKLISRFRPGVVVRLSVKRGKKTLVKSVKLAKLVTPATRKRDMLNSTGGGMSRRHNDFPVVLQHDSLLRPVDCGGPLVTLDGRAVGVNIARGGRTETYCIPANALVMLMYDLMSGRKRPLSSEEKKTSAHENIPELKMKEKPKKFVVPLLKKKFTQPKLKFPKSRDKKKQKREVEKPTRPPHEHQPKPPALKQEAKPKPKAKTKPKTEGKSVPKAKTKPTPKTEPEPKQNTAPKAKLKLKPEPDKKADAKSPPKENPKAKDSDKPKAEKKEAKGANPNWSDKPPKESQDVPNSELEKKTSPEPELDSSPTSSSETLGPQPTPVGEPLQI